MPELPEVEVTRQTLEGGIVGARILAARLGKPLRWPLGGDPQALVGHTVRAVRRRGKYLLIDLSSGLLIVHLGMSGSLTLGAQASAPGPHDHFDLDTDRGLLRLHDPRRFGAVILTTGEGSSTARALLAHLGVEPLEDGFDPETFYRQLRTRRSAIKTVLLAGDLVVGVGNIYACEALFAAGIRPTTRAHRLSRARVQRLHQAIRAVLGHAVACGGSTLRDYRNAQGQVGRYQQQVAVYGRAGQPCPVCATPVRLIRQGQRSSYFCPHCQPR